jgi:colanic acid/amylovoran biosynthesis glycosyltransferase
MNAPLTAIHATPLWLSQTQTWMHTQALALAPQGVEVHVVCERTQHLDQFPVPHLHSLETCPAWRRAWERALRRLRLRRYSGLLVEMGRRLPAQLVHSHFGNIGWDNLGALRRLGLPHVVTFYGLDVSSFPRHPRWYRRYQRLFAEASLFLCEGPHMARCLVALGCPERKVRVQHLGIDLDKIPFTPRQWQRGEPLRVLIAATFREKKGVPDALEVLGRIKHRVPLEITLIGEATAEPRSQQERRRIMETIARHELGPQIRMLGFQPHRVLHEEATRHHLFLSPSITAADGDTEGGAPVTIIEMAAAGMPVISTTHCDIPEVLAPSRERYLAAEGDVDGLAARLLALLDDWPQLGETLAAQRRYIEAEYDWRRQGERLAAHYRSLVESPA